MATPNPQHMTYPIKEVTDPIVLMVSSGMNVLTNAGLEHWMKPNMKLIYGGSITTTSDRIAH